MAPTDDEPEISILDARLAEIDRRLQSVQGDLIADQPAGQAPPIAVPGDRFSSTGPRPVPPPPAPRAEPALPADAATAPQAPTAPPGETAPPAATDRTLTHLRELTAAQQELLAATRELLGTVERVAAAGSAPVTVSAGPLDSTDALHAFRAALESLPGVRAVELRGFEGGDRAVLDVHL